MTNIENYDDFKHALYEKTRIAFPRHETELFLLLDRNVESEAISVTPYDSRIGAVCRPDDLYDKYLQGYSVNQIAQEEIGKIRSALSSWSEYPFCESDYRNNISFFVVNPIANRRLLCMCPNRPLEGTDLVTLPRWILPDGASFPVSFAVAKNIHLSTDAVLDLANSQINITSIQSYLVTDRIHEILQANQISDSYITEFQKYYNAEIPLFSITENMAANCSCVLLNDLFLRNYYVHNRNSFYIIPWDVNECFFISQDFVSDPNELEDLFRFGVHLHVPKRDFLSDQLYFYDGKSISTVKRGNKRITSKTNTTADQIITLIRDYTQLRGRFDCKPARFRFAF